MQTTTSKDSANSAKRQPARLRIIRTKRDHDLAMERMLNLIKQNPPRGSAEFDEMEVLGLLIDKYEQEHFHMDDPSPIAIIKFLMDQQGLKKKDLIPYIGSAPKVTEVLNGTRGLSLSMIRKLSDGLKIPVGLLIKESEKKRA